MKTSIIPFLRENRQEIEESWRRKLEQFYSEIYQDDLQQQFTEISFEKSVKIIEGYCKTQNLEKVIESLVNLDKPAHRLFRLVELLESSTYDVLMQKENKTLQEVLEVMNTIRRFKIDISILLVKEYENKYENIIKLQKLNLQQLSTPVMRILDQVIIIPIVGTIDEERSKELMEKVLYAVVENKAEIILIDITGVPLVDSTVAYHLIQLVNAIHIVGGQSMLVGIKPEIAQTFVMLGVDLGNVVTLGTLKEGIELALEQTNRKISEVESNGF